MATKQTTVRSAVVWRHAPLSWTAGLLLAGGDDVSSRPAIGCRAVIRNLIDTWRICDRETFIIDRVYTRSKGVFDVSRTTKILRRPGPKCHSMSRGRRRFYVTTRRIFVIREDFLSVLCSGTRQWWRTFLVKVSCRYDQHFWRYGLVKLNNHGISENLTFDLP